MVSYMLVIISLFFLLIGGATWYYTDEVIQNDQINNMWAGVPGYGTGHWILGNQLKDIVNNFFWLGLPVFMLIWVIAHGYSQSQKPF